MAACMQSLVQLVKSSGSVYSLQDSQDAISSSAPISCNLLMPTQPGWPSLVPGLQQLFAQAPFKDVPQLQGLVHGAQVQQQQGSGVGLPSAALTGVQHRDNSCAAFESCPPALHMGSELALGPQGPGSNVGPHPALPQHALGSSLQVHQQQQEQPAGACPERDARPGPVPLRLIERLPASLDPAASADASLSLACGQCQPSRSTPVLVCDVLAQPDQTQHAVETASQPPQGVRLPGMVANVAASQQQQQQQQQPQPQDALDVHNVLQSPGQQQNQDAAGITAELAPCSQVLHHVLLAPTAALAQPRPSTPTLPSSPNVLLQQIHNTPETTQPLAPAPTPNATVTHTGGVTHVGVSPEHDGWVPGAPEHSGGVPSSQGRKRQGSRLWDVDGTSDEDDAAVLSKQQVLGDTFMVEPTSPGLHLDLVLQPTSQHDMDCEQTKVMGGRSLQSLVPDVGNHADPTAQSPALQTRAQAAPDMGLDMSSRMEEALCCGNSHASCALRTTDQILHQASEQAVQLHAAAAAAQQGRQLADEEVVCNSSTLSAQQEPVEHMAIVEVNVCASPSAAVSHVLAEQVIAASALPLCQQSDKELPPPSPGLPTGPVLGPPGQQPAELKEVLAAAAAAAAPDAMASPQCTSPGVLRPHGIPAVRQCIDADKQPIGGTVGTFQYDVSQTQSTQPAPGNRAAAGHLLANQSNAPALAAGHAHQHNWQQQVHGHGVEQGKGGMCWPTSHSPAAFTLPPPGPVPQPFMDVTNQQQPVDVHPLGHTPTMQVPWQQQLPLAPQQYMSASPWQQQAHVQQGHPTTPVTGPLHNLGPTGPHGMQSCMPQPPPQYCNDRHAMQHAAWPSNGMQQQQQPHRPVSRSPSPHVQVPNGISYPAQPAQIVPHDGMPRTAWQQERQAWWPSAPPSATTTPGPSPQPHQCQGPWQAGPGHAGGYHQAHGSMWTPAPDITHVRPHQTSEQAAYAGQQMQWSRPVNPQFGEQQQYQQAAAPQQYQPHMPNAVPQYAQRGPVPRGANHHQHMQPWPHATAQAQQHQQQQSAIPSLLGSSMLMPPMTTPPPTPTAGMADFQQQQQQQQLQPLQPQRTPAAAASFFNTTALQHVHSKANTPDPCQHRFDTTPQGPGHTPTATQLYTGDKPTTGTAGSTLSLVMPSIATANITPGVVASSSAKRPVQRQAATKLGINKDNFKTVRPGGSELAKGLMANRQNRKKQEEVPADSIPARIQAKLAAQGKLGASRKMAACQRSAADMQRIFAALAAIGDGQEDADIGMDEGQLDGAEPAAVRAGGVRPAFTMLSASALTVASAQEPAPAQEPLPSTPVNTDLAAAPAETLEVVLVPHGPSNRSEACAIDDMDKACMPTTIEVGRPSTAAAYDIAVTAPPPKHTAEGTHVQEVQAVRSAAGSFAEPNAAGQQFNTVQQHCAVMNGMSHFNGFSSMAGHSSAAAGNMAPTTVVPKSSQSQQPTAAGALRGRASGRISRAGLTAATGGAAFADSYTQDEEVEAMLAMADELLRRNQEAPGTAAPASTVAVSVTAAPVPAAGAEATTAPTASVATPAPTPPAHAAANTGARTAALAQDAGSTDVATTAAVSVISYATDACMQPCLDACSNPTAESCLPPVPSQFTDLQRLISHDSHSMQVPRGDHAQEDGPSALPGLSTAHGRQLIVDQESLAAVAARWGGSESHLQPQQPVCVVATHMPVAARGGKPQDHHPQQQQQQQQQDYAHYLPGIDNMMPGGLQDSMLQNAALLPADAKLPSEVQPTLPENKTLAVTPTLAQQQQGTTMVPCGSYASLRAHSCSPSPRLTPVPSRILPGLLTAGGRALQTDLAAGAAALGAALPRADSTATLNAYPVPANSPQALNTTPLAQPEGDAQNCSDPNTAGCNVQPGAQTNPQSVVQRGEPGADLAQALDSAASGGGTGLDACQAPAVAVAPMGLVATAAGLLAGLTTASGQKVQLSAHAKAQAALLLGADHTSAEPSTNAPGEPVHATPAATPTGSFMAGLTTASGKAPLLSAQAQAAAAALLGLDQPDIMSGSALPTALAEQADDDGGNAQNLPTVDMIVEGAATVVHASSIAGAVDNMNVLAGLSTAAPAGKTLKRVQIRGHGASRQQQPAAGTSSASAACSVPVHPHADALQTPALRGAADGHQAGALPDGAVIRLTFATPAPTTAKRATKRKPGFITPASRTPLAAPFVSPRMQPPPRPTPQATPATEASSKRRRLSVPGVKSNSTETGAERMTLRQVCLLPEPPTHSRGILSCSISCSIQDITGGNASNVLLEGPAAGMDACTEQAQQAEDTAGLASNVDGDLQLAAQANMDIGHTAQCADIVPPGIANIIPADSSVQPRLDADLNIASWNAGGPDQARPTGSAALGVAAWGVSDAHQELLMAGASPAHATLDWVRNHYRWIVWKLAAGYEGALRGKAGAAYNLTRQNVLAQLQYRYNREVCDRKHSALYRVMMRDVDPRVPITVVVSALHPPHQQPQQPNQDTAQSDTKQDDQGNCVAAAVSKAPGAASAGAMLIEVTDGWYPAVLKLDVPLTNLVHTGLIKEGCKLRLMGAAIQGSQEPLPPLEALAAGICLTIHRNGCSPCGWDEQLGHARRPMSVLPLCNIHPEGGLVPHTVVVVQAQYPVQFWEKNGPEGRSAFRTRKAQEARVQQVAKLQAQAAGCGMEEGACEDAAGNWHMGQQGERLGVPTRMVRVSAVLPPGRAPTGAELGAQALLRLWRAVTDDDDSAGGSDSSGLQEGGVYLVTDLTPLDMRKARHGGMQVGSHLMELQASKATQWHLLGKAADLMHAPDSKQSAGWHMQWAGARPHLKIADLAMLEHQATTLRQANQDAYQAASTAAWQRAERRAQQRHATVASSAVDDMGAAALVQSCACPATWPAEFDYTGLLLAASPIKPVAGSRIGMHEQWLFLLDESCMAMAQRQGAQSDVSAADARQLTEPMQEEQGHTQPWLLGVQVWGSRESVDFVDHPPAADMPPSRVTFRYLHLEQADEVNHVWRARATSYSSSTAVVSQASRSSATEPLLKWAETHAAVLAAARTKATTLIG